MELKKVYAEYFREEDRYLPYADESAYREALFCYLRIKFIAGYELQQGNETAESASRVIEGAEYHISTRLRLTGDRVNEFRFERLCDRFCADEWSRFLLLYTYAVSEDTVFAALVRNAGSELRSGYRDAQLLFSVCDTLSQGLYAAGVEKKLPVFRYLIDTEDSSDAVFIMRLPKRVSGFLNSTDESPDDEADIGNGQYAGIVGYELEDYAEITAACEYELPIRRDTQEKLCELIGRMTDLSAGAEGCAGILPDDDADVNIWGTRKRGFVLQMHGPDGIGKREMLCSATGGKPVLFVDMKKLPAATVPELRQILKRIRRECALSNAIPAFYGYNPVKVPEREDVPIPATDAAMAFMYRELAGEYPFSVWITSEKADYLLTKGMHVLFFELPMLNAGERLELWKHCTESVRLADEVDLTACANQYILTPASLREVVWNASLRAGAGPIGKEDIRESVADQVVNQLGTMATHIRSIYTWDDLVIDDRERRHLQMICDQVRYRGIVGEEWGFYQKTAYGRGICALFYGQPGTGKTMAAQVIANELGLELYRIDLSQMVSKYIGETQKNVTKLFDRAKNTNAILFFDEADSLFSKRSEVKDFHDKNSNAETAHLLQKLEDYEGITILATNYEQNIDDAFKRRIKFFVNFVFPDPPVRRALFHTIIPPGAPVEERLDLDFFADTFEMSGSNIKEVLTAAAFLAASEGRGIKNIDIVEAIKLNFEKHGKVLNDSDFGYLAES
ncbi:MAG: ATP-binding protein [Eubacterium sp.]|nr:ATP-binding protein [Eubacterium sp.]